MQNHFELCSFFQDLLLLWFNMTVRYWCNLPRAIKSPNSSKPFNRSHYWRGEWATAHKTQQSLRLYFFLEKCPFFQKSDVELMAQIQCILPMSKNVQDMWILFLYSHSCVCQLRQLLHQYNKGVKLNTATRRWIKQNINTENLTRCRHASSFVRMTTGTHIK